MRLTKESPISRAIVVVSLCLAGSWCLEVLLPGFLLTLGWLCFRFAEFSSFLGHGLLIYILLKVYSFGEAGELTGELRLVKLFAIWIEDFLFFFSKLEPFSYWTLNQSFRLMSRNFLISLFSFSSSSTVDFWDYISAAMLACSSIKFASNLTSRAMAFCFPFSYSAFISDTRINT